jgi:hypothetical protein
MFDVRCSMSDVGLLDCWIVGLLDCWIVGLLVVGLLVVGLLVVGLLDCWIVGLLDVGCSNRMCLPSCRTVAAAILAAVEGGILPPGPEALKRKCLQKSRAISAGQEARLFSRQDACRYGKP